MKGYPNWFFPGLIGTLALAIITGLFLSPTTLSLRSDIIAPWRLPGSSRVLCAALHAIGSFSLVFFVGALWSVHMRSGWRRNKQRNSGLFLGILLLTLTFSAIVIYYAGEESLGKAAALFHLGAGLTLPALFGWHGLHGRRASRKSNVKARFFR